VTVYHGLPEGLYRCYETPVLYPVFLGRISPEKRVNRAIEIAKRIGMAIKIAAKVDAADRAYCEDIIAPRLAKAST
jgi:glycosyltransferase involved in cell wall biosynthesis